MNMNDENVMKLQDSPKANEPVCNFLCLSKLSENEVSKSKLKHIEIMVSLTVTITKPQLY